MPQITKVRIVNFLYNDGKRLIADELFSFENEDRPSDTLINLTNGGGKSVLVQLMMQPVIPRAKVAGRRIESFFTKSTDHCYIVIEWQLDNSKMKLMTGIAIAASDASSDTDNVRGFQIKYYTFISSYLNYESNYNIVSLPLSRREGGRFVPAAYDDVRNLVKRSGGALERYSSDDSLKWQERLSEYGIIQNEWRMIEQLNSNEDGLSKFFSDLKTSDALIDRLIIPRIEEKQSHSERREDSSLETMLIAYARQFSRQQEIITEREICAGFCNLLKKAKAEDEELWKSDDSLKASIERLFSYIDALGREAERQNTLLSEHREERASCNDEIRKINWEQASLNYYNCKDAFDAEETRHLNAKDEYNAAAERLKQLKQRLALIECARYHSQLTETESQIAAVATEIRNREQDSDSAHALAALKYSAFVSIQAALCETEARIGKLEQDKNDNDTKRDTLAARLSKAQDEYRRAERSTDRAKAELDIRQNENDMLIEELAIGAYRMLDGRYAADELLEWQTAEAKRDGEIASLITELEEKIGSDELRSEELPQELADMGTQLNELRRESQSIDAELEAYRALEAEVKSVCEQNGIDFELRFTDNAHNYLCERLSVTEASIKDNIRQAEGIGEELEAAAKGTLHIPKRLADFLDSTGIRYTSFEKYLLSQINEGHITNESVKRLLDEYPHAAYGVIIEPAEYELLCQESEGKWLPSLLPVFTMTEVGSMIENKAAHFRALAAYSHAYFADNRVYADRLRDELDRMKQERAQLEARATKVRGDLAVIDRFGNYDKDWADLEQAEKARNEIKIGECQDKIAKLQTELSLLKSQLSVMRTEAKRLNLEQSEQRQKLAEFAKLMTQLENENTLFQSYDMAVKRLRELDDQTKTLKQQYTDAETRGRALAEELRSYNVTKTELDGNLLLVNDAVVCDIIDGNWRALLEQYEVLLKAQSADLDRLNADMTRLLREKSEKLDEINKRGCELHEYAQLVYTKEREATANDEVKLADDYCHDCERIYIEANAAYAKAEANLENTTGRLSEFGGEPLPRGQVGRDFAARTAVIKQKIAGLDAEIMSTEKRLSELEWARGRADSAAEAFKRPAKPRGITLDEDYSGQLKQLTAQIRNCTKRVEDGRRILEADIDRMDKEYANRSVNVRISVAKLREVLSTNYESDDRYFTLLENIESNIHTTELKIAQIDTDLAEFRKTKDDLIHQCVLQGQQIYEGLMKLSDSSKVKVQDKRRQMLRFDLPDSIDENVAAAAITAELDKGTQEIVEKLAEADTAESEINRIASRTVGSKRLLRKYIGSENILLKAYKIDRNPENSGYRTWEQTQVNNSGAEKFVVYFAVILALMAYTRDSLDANGDKYNRSVLILDNPFGPISSKHVLMPMFEISKKYGVQMICLSDISKSDIVTCFDIVIRSVVRQFALSGREQLTHDGNEAIEHGFYRSEQIRFGE